MDIQPLSEDGSSAWSELVRRSPQGTLFHEFEWYGATGCPVRMYGVYRGGELLAGCAVGVLGGRMGGHHPLTAYSGPLLPPSHGKYVGRLSEDKEILGALAERLIEDFDSVWMRCPPELVDLQPFQWRGMQAGVRYTYRMHLGRPEEMLDMMDARRRNDIRRAERQGIWIDGEASVADVLVQAGRSFERQGIVPEPGATRVAARLAVMPRSKAFLARDATGKALGGVWLAWDHRRAYYCLGGYDHASHAPGAGALALWRAITYAAEHLELEEFDFEGSMLQPVELFFRHFGGTLMPTYTISWTRRSSLLRRARNRALRLLRRLWRSDSVQAEE